MAKSDLEALNAALSALNHVSVAIKLVSQYLASIQRKLPVLELEFDRKGAFKAAYYRHDKERQPIPDDGLIDIRSDCEWLPKHVKSLWEAWPGADSAIQSLPRHLVEKLDALTNSPWIASVRRHCLDNILKWPGEVHHQTSYAAEKVSGTVPEFLKKAEQSDPFSTWDEYQRLLATYTHDLYAIRDAISPPPPAPAQTEGTDTDDLMTREEISWVVGVTAKTIANKKLLGAPDRDGGGRGIKAAWHYLRVKPSLEARLGIDLPSLGEAKTIVTARRSV